MNTRYRYDAAQVKPTKKGFYLPHVSKFSFRTTYEVQQLLSRLVPIAMMRRFLIAFLWGRSMAFPLVGDIYTNARRRATVAAVTASVSDVLLADLGVPNGLRETLLTNVHQVFSKRIWIVDNSGSMSMMDGRQVLDIDTECTRWAEVQETVNCHAQLSAALGAPTDFRLLNPPQSGGPQKFRVGYGNAVRKESKRALSIMSQNKPNGMTPLFPCISEVRNEVIRMLPQLKADGKKVSIIIATDGSNNDKTYDEDEMNQQLVSALESLQGLPVCVVIRLCTDYEPLIDFYNTLDGKLEFNLDVLDDHIAEADEVYAHNKWLNYNLLLHRIREMGQISELFDLMDERAFTKDEIRDFCVLLFGKENFLDPQCEWASFLGEVDIIQQTERMHWNPQTKGLSPWIDIKEIELLE